MFTLLDFCYSPHAIILRLSNIACTQLNISECIGVVDLVIVSTCSPSYVLKEHLQYHSSPAGETVYHYADVKPKLTQPVYQAIESDSAHQDNQPQYEVPKFINL